MKKLILREAARVVRHGITPLAVAAVAAGWLPAEMQAEAVEIAVVGGTFVVSLALSFLAPALR